MATEMITLKNNFHNTEIRVRKSSVALLDEHRDALTRSQKRTVDRICARLCGVVRGPQD